jgi:uncharacterized protein (DUF2141 family)
MKRISCLSFGFLLISNFVIAQYNLEVEITGLRNNTGKVMFQLFDEKEVVLTQLMGEIKENESHFSIKDLKPGKYAVRYYHDENLNGKMETNMVGKPTEGYGFSNNVTGSFGPPPFEKWLFEISGDKKIILKPVY